MIRLHAISILKPLGIAVLLAFVMQFVVVEAEHFGLFDCESLSASFTSSSKDAKNVPTESCHASCCGHLIGVFSSPSQFATILHHGQMNFVLTDDLAPDGPVKAIDHPPQLS